LHTLEYANEIGLGSRNYNLVNIDSQEDSSVSMIYENGELTINGLTSTASLIHISYNENSEVMNFLEILDAANGIQDVKAKKGDKFLLWKSIASMTPLCKAVTADRDSANKGKPLVVYYSATNNTKRIGDIIADYINADIFEIEPKIPYTSDDLRWTDPLSRVNDEHNNPDTRHTELVSTDVENFDSYDTVFIGYPIWWYEASWVVDDFVKKNDFTGKTVIPFCTSSSSPLGNSGTKLAEMAGTGNWTEGNRFSSGASESSVKTWIDSFNLKK